MLSWKLISSMMLSWMLDIRHDVVRYKHPASAVTTVTMRLDLPSHHLPDFPSHHLPVSVEERYVARPYWNRAQGSHVQGKVVSVERGQASGSIPSIWLPQLSLEMSRTSSDSHSWQIRVTKSLTTSSASAMSQVFNTVITKSPMRRDIN